MLTQQEPAPSCSLFQASSFHDTTTSPSQSHLTYQKQQQNLEKDITSLQSTPTANSNPIDFTLQQMIIVFFLQFSSYFLFPHMCHRLIQEAHFFDCCCQCTNSLLYNLQENIFSLTCCFNKQSTGDCFPGSFLMHGLTIDYCFVCFLLPSWLCIFTCQLFTQHVLKFIVLQVDCCAPCCPLHMHITVPLFSTQISIVHCCTGNCL